MTANFTCHTGGALGADTHFLNICKEYDIPVHVHSFEGHKQQSPDTILHTQEELFEADEHLMKVSQFLKRPFPLKNRYSTNLLRRNYQIVKSVDTVYAIGRIESEYIIDGGTGWACELARQLDKLVFVYNIEDKKWYTSQGKTNYWPLEEEPLLAPAFAGIGTRKINKVGIYAIRSLISNGMK